METLPLALDILALLFITAVTAGFIDTLAGGGGLIALPALILAGIPPLQALGTNKLQGCIGTATSTYLMIKKGRVTIAEIKPLLITAFIGSSLGCIGVQFINSDALAVVIPIVLIIIAVYFLIAPTPSTDSNKKRVTENQYKNGVIPVIGFYDGFFGPGTGSFFALSSVVLNGKNLISATALAKPLNCATNIAALIIFISLGQVAWLAGITMLIGQIIGASIGSHTLLKINPLYIRILIVIMCVAMLVKYCFYS